MTDLELELWAMLGEVLSLATPHFSAMSKDEQAKIQEIENRYGFICDEMDTKDDLKIAA